MRFGPFVLVVGLALGASWGVAACHLHGDLAGDDISEAGTTATLDLALCGVPIEDPPNSTGITWTDLYRDYFGPTGRAGSCSLNHTCHGPDAKAEHVATSGYYSGPGIHCEDEAACLASILGKNLVRDSDSAAPLKSNLFDILRVCQSDGTSNGIMPRDPVASFSQTGSHRIAAWIAGRKPVPAGTTPTN